MRIIFNEMRKIWNWKILAVIVVVCAMFYIMFMRYYVEHYRIGNHPQAEEIHFVEELTRRFGTSVTAEQFAGFIEEERAPLVAEAEEYFKTMPIFAEAEIHSWVDYTDMRAGERELTQAESDAYQSFWLENSDLYYHLAALENLESHFDYSVTVPDNPDSFYTLLNEKEQARIDRLLADNEHRSIIGYWTYDFTDRYVMFFSVLLILSVLILVSPLLTNDRHGRVHYLQYSSKHGRKIMRRQLIATLLSAFALTTLLILIFGGVFSQNGTYLFWDNQLGSDFTIGIYKVFALTYGEWVIAAIALMYALALGASMLAFILSRFSGSLITLTMKLIPLFVVMIFLCANVFPQMFGMFNALYQMLRVFGTEAYVCGAVFAAAFAAAWFVIRREKRADVM